MDGQRTEAIQSGSVSQVKNKEDDIKGIGDEQAEIEKFRTENARAIDTIESWKNIENWREDVEKEKQEEIITQYKLQNTPEGTPQLVAFDDGEGHLVVWCDWCEKTHRHGMTYGHREAHCSGELGNMSPYEDTGYVLVPPPTELVKFKREEIAKRLVRQRDEINLRAFNDRTVMYSKYSHKKRQYVIAYRDATDADRRDEAVHFLMTTETLVTVKETDEILYYEDGCYKKGGEHRIHKWLASKYLYGNKLEPGTYKAILDVIRSQTRISIEKFDADKNIINLRNGLYHISENKLEPHSVDYYSLRQKPIDYDATAKPKVWGTFLKQILYPGEIRTAVEAAAYTFWRANPFENYFLLVGIGRNGKSKYGNGIAAMHGLDNVSNTPLTLLVGGNQFVNYDLEGKDMNISTESSTSMRDMDAIKRLTTTQNKLRLEKKGVQAYEGFIWAKLWMNTNKVPDSDDDSDAHFAREVILVFPNQFLGKNADPDILDKLTTEEEKSGMFNVLMIALRRVLANGGIYQPESNIEARRLKNKRVKDPIAAFAEECLSFERTESKDQISGREMHSAYEQWCRVLQLPIEKEQTFVKKLKDMRTPMDYSKISKADQRLVFKGVKFSNHILKMLGRSIAEETLDQ